MEPHALFDAFFSAGSVKGDEAAPASAPERLAFIKAHWKDEAFRRRAWPFVAAFVDASNVARWDRPAVHEVTKDKAQVRWLVRADEELRRLAYVPVMVSDANLVHIIDEPWTFTERYGKYPHVATPGQKADNVVLRALRSLPEAVCVTRDRFGGPDEQRAYPDVLSEPSRFFAYRFEDDGAVRFFRGDEPLPHAARRMAERVGRPMRTA